MTGLLGVRRSRATATCHSGGDVIEAPAGAPVVAIVGAPNAGKSTLFNALTGGHRNVGNWPGTSVEVGTGSWTAAGTDVALLDLPGAYSLDAQSPDEELTRDLLRAPDASDRPEVTVVVADTAHLTRSLYLVTQLRELPQRLVVALTVIDVAERRGITVDTPAMARALGVPVIELDPRRRDGSERLEAAVASALLLTAPEPRAAVAGIDTADPAADGAARLRRRRRVARRGRATYQAGGRCRRHGG